jgi:Na+/alanine symporter
VSETPLERDLQFIRETLQSSMQHLQRIGLLLSTWLVVGNGTGVLTAINVRTTVQSDLNPIPSAWLFLIGLVFAFAAVLALWLVGRRVMNYLTSANTFFRRRVQAEYNIAVIGSYRRTRGGDW